MKGSPTQSDMVQPSYIERGRPKYIDQSVEDVPSKFYPNRGHYAPAYVANNPRYWEYR